jgi:hypothetical protein
MRAAPDPRPPATNFAGGGKKVPWWAGQLPYLSVPVRQPCPRFFAARAAGGFGLFLFRISRVIDATVKQTIDGVAAELKRIRRDREMVMRQREELQAGPSSKSDLLKLLDDMRRAVEVSDFSRLEPMKAMDQRIEELDEEERLIAEQVEANGLRMVWSRTGRLYMQAIDTA